MGYLQEHLTDNSEHKRRQQWSPPVIIVQPSINFTSGPNFLILHNDPSILYLRSPHSIIVQPFINLNSGPIYDLSIVVQPSNNFNLGPSLNCSTTIHQFFIRPPPPIIVHQFEFKPHPLIVVQPSNNFNAGPIPRLLYNNPSILIQAPSLDCVLQSYPFMELLP